MDTKQHIQNDQYIFPYHHLAREGNGTFSQVRHIAFGYIYISYISIIVELLKNMRFESLLDVGCGDGKLLFEIHKALQNKTLEGIDYSPRAIALAQAFNPELTLYSRDITDSTTLKKSYDIVTLIETLEHIPPTEREPFLKAINSHMKKDGTLLITVPSDNDPVDTKHYQHFNVSSLKKILSPHFFIEEYQFLNTQGFLNTCIHTLLSNRLFILNQYTLVNMIYNFYTKHLLHATSKNGKRILAVCKKIT